MREFLGWYYIRQPFLSSQYHILLAGPLLFEDKISKLSLDCLLNVKRFDENAPYY
jgi:hypothetical protein